MEKIHTELENTSEKVVAIEEEKRGLLNPYIEKEAEV